MKRAISILLALVFTGFLIPTTGHRASAQDTGATAVATPAEVIDQTMNLIGQGRIDDAVAGMEGLKNQTELKQEARARLITLRDDQGQYHGYDIAAIQHLTGQFERIDVLAYYDDQPVLFRYHFYRPQVQNGGKWAILGFQISTSVAEISDILRDTPVDYVGHKNAKGE